MAGRQGKVGLDYFFLDCHMDDKVRLIQAEFGLKGFAVVVKLFQKIYGECGYYCEWNEDLLFLFMSENGLSGDNKNLISEVVSACIRRNIFSEKLYKKYGILTSSGVQKRYLNAVSERKSIEMKKEYLLISIPENIKNVVINSINRPKNSINRPRNAQSREEESRVDKSREEESRVEERREESALSDTDVSDCPSAGATDTYQDIIDLWNTLQELGITPIRDIGAGSKRRTLVRARLKQYGFDGFVEAVHRIRDSDFLQGKHSGRPWQIKFDWMILPSNFQKVIEGNYDNNGNSYNSNGGYQQSKTQQMLEDHYTMVDEWVKRMEKSNDS